MRKLPFHDATPAAVRALYAPSVGGPISGTDHPPAVCAFVPFSFVHIVILPLGQPSANQAMETDGLPPAAHLTVRHIGEVRHCEVRVA